MKPVIGLHIDTSSVNAAQVDNHKGQARLIKAAVDTNPDVASALKAVLSKFPTGHASIICTFHDPQIFVRKITTPPMPLQELGPAVRLAVKNTFPFSLDEAVLDFRLVNKSSYQGKERYNVLVAAAPRKVIEGVRDLFLNAKVKLSSCIPAAIALENLIARSGAKPDETLAVIVLGAAVTEMAIYQNSHLEFSRKLSMSAGDITKSMTGSFFSDTGKTELTFTEAQGIMKEFGIPKPDEEVQINEKITSQQVIMLVGPKIEQLATEINRSLDYYREELQGAKVDRVLLVGEVSLLKRLDEFLSEQLGLEVKCVDLLAGMGLKDEAQQQLLAVGAALQGIQGINLLSKGEGSTRKTDPNVLKGVVIAIMATLAIAFLYLNDQVQSKNEQAGMKAQEFITRLTEERDLRHLKESRPLWKDILDALSYMPGAIYLKEIHFNENQLHIQGDVLGEGKDPKATLAEFISSLREKYLKDARLKSLTKVKDETDEFEFEIIAGIEAVKP